MISTQIICAELAQQDGFISTVELAMVLEASASEVRDGLFKLGDRVIGNEHGEWRIAGSLIHESEFPPLSEAEIELKKQLENTVSQAFFVAGKALKELGDKKLYRETHATFESYVKDQFGYKKSAAYYLINAAKVVDNLNCPQFVDKNQSQIILPTSESQCRPIAKLPPKQQREVWQQAVEKAGGKVPPARIIKQVVKELWGEEPKMISKKNRKDGPTIVSGIGIEYIAVLDEETYFRLKDCQQRMGKATLNGTIRQLLDRKEQENNEG